MSSSIPHNRNLLAAIGFVTARTSCAVQSRIGGREPIPCRECVWRIESVLDWARVQGHCEGDNPARWRGHLENLLPAKAKIVTVNHFAAMPYAELGTFMAELKILSRQFAGED